MKIVLFFLVCCMQQMVSNASLSSLATFLGFPSLGPECMTLTQLYKTTQTLCLNKTNTDWWNAVIECHRPMTDDFMRLSGEAQCPLPKYVQQANDTSYSINDVFFNICGLVEGSLYQLAQTGWCLVNGQSDPYIMDHQTEVKTVKNTFGEDVPCNVGKCVLALGIPMN